MRSERAAFGLESHGVQKMVQTWVVLKKTVSTHNSVMHINSQEQGDESNCICNCLEV